MDDVCIDPAARDLLVQYTGVSHGLPPTCPPHTRMFGTPSFRSGAPRARGGGMVIAPKAENAEKRARRAAYTSAYRDAYAASFTYDGRTRSISKASMKDLAHEQGVMIKKDAMALINGYMYSNVYGVIKHAAALAKIRAGKQGAKGRSGYVGTITIKDVTQAIRAIRSKKHRIAIPTSKSAKAAFYSKGGFKRAANFGGAGPSSRAASAIYKEMIAGGAARSQKNWGIAMKRAAAERRGGGK